MFQKNGVYQCEDRRVRPDAKRQGEYRGNHKAGHLAKVPDSVASVLDQCRMHFPSPRDLQGLSLIHALNTLGRQSIGSERSSGTDSPRQFLSHLLGPGFFVSFLYSSDTYDKAKRQEVFGFTYKRPRSDTLPRKTTL